MAKCIRDRSRRLRWMLIRAAVICLHVFLWKQAIDDCTPAPPPLLLGPHSSQWFYSPASIRSGLHPDSTQPAFLHIVPGFITEIRNSGVLLSNRASQQCSAQRTVIGAPVLNGLSYPLIEPVFTARPRRSHPGAAGPTYGRNPAQSAEWVRWAFPLGWFTTDRYSLLLRKAFICS